MIFTTEIDSTKVLAIYDQNILVFKSEDLIKTVSKAVITISGITLELTPNINGEFKLDISEIVRPVAGGYRFRDPLEYNLETSSTYLIPDLYFEIAITFQIKYTDNSNESTSRDYKFLRSVNKEGTLDREEFPFVLVPNDSRSYHLTYFEGYPYTIPFTIQAASGDYLITNKRLSLSIEVQFLKGVNHWCISDGLIDSTINDSLPLISGYNELRIGSKYAPTIKPYTIMLKKLESTTGLYLRWFNQSGGYSYWLFPYHTNTVTNNKTISEVSSDGKELYITGKKSDKKISTVSQKLTKEERRYLSEIFESPRVEMLDADPFTEVKASDWKYAKVQDGSISDKSKYKNAQKLPITILVQSPNKQSL